ncbi:MAG: hypothetical protein C0405_13590, partial [Desulfovibrio sp.]|nr:hypothetical protein [Desulfovibrio sp.]
ITGLRLRLAQLEAQLAHVDLAGGKSDMEQALSLGMLNSLFDSMYVVDAADFRILDCNQIFPQRLGLSREQVLGRPCHEFTSRRLKPCPGPGDWCHVLKVVADGKPGMAELNLVDEGGRPYYIECNALPLFNAQGRVDRVLHVHRNITRRKEALLKLEQANQEQARLNTLSKRLLERFEEANRQLSHSNAFLRNLINSSVDAIIAADMTGKIILFNEAAGRITGYSEAEAVNYVNIRAIYPGDGARKVMALLRSDQHGGKGKLLSQEVELLCKDRSLVPVSLSAAVVMDGDQEVATVGIFYDLRAKRRMEQELDKTRVQLLQAEKMASIGKLAAGVAHQLNNPLAGITLYANILAEEYDLPQAALDDLKRILDNAERSRTTIKELLQFSRQTRQEVSPAN